MLGVHVRRTRFVVIVLAVLLAAAAVTLAGPIGFVGLCAPVIVRLLGRAVPRLHQHLVLVPLAGLAGALIVIGSDVLLRAVLGAQAGVEVPTGVVTTLLGAAVLVWLARRHRDSGPDPPPARGEDGGAALPRLLLTVVAVCALAVVGALVAGMLLGDTIVLTGDLLNWLRGHTGPGLTFVLDQRYPRVAAALLAGAALAMAGTTVQAVCRNPLAEPGILGITGGAGVGAVVLITVAPAAGVWAMTGVAGLGCAGRLRDRLRAVLARRSPLRPTGADRGRRVSRRDRRHHASASSPSTRGTPARRSPGCPAPPTVAPSARWCRWRSPLLLVTPLIVAARRELDLLSLDDDTPRVLGVRLEPIRLAALGGAALLAATAVSAVGVIGFVGLVAPHAARALVGGRHFRVLPVAVLLGALVVSLADTLGRTVIAPAQIPAGLVTALIGTPYFVWLLWRSTR